MHRAELSTPLGFFNFALSYRAAADKLRVCKLRATHPHSPILFNYYHSIELYLKAFLRSHGASVASLRDVGHNFRKLRQMCIDKGLVLNEEDETVLAIISQQGAWARTRYLEFGYAQFPRITAIARAARRIDRSVGKTLSEKGIHVRRVRHGVRASD